MGWAIDGARTRDIQDHNLALYLLSYDRHTRRLDRPPAPDASTRRKKEVGQAPFDYAVARWADCRAAIHAPMRANASCSTLSFLQKAKRA